MSIHFISLSLSLSLFHARHVLFWTILHIPPQEWEKVYYAASTHLVKEEKEKKLDEAAELIEQVQTLKTSTS